MSIGAGSRPKWLYWPKDGYGQFHVSWLRLHIAFAAGTKSRRRTDDYASYTSRQRSAADDLALDRHAVYTQYAVFAPAESSAFAPAESTALALRWFIVLRSPSVARRRFSLYIGIGGSRSPLPQTMALELS